MNKKLDKKIQAILVIMLLGFFSCNMLLFASGQQERVLIIGHRVEPTSLNPDFGDVSYNDQIACQIYNSLVRYDRQAELTPDLAESWTWSGDGKTLTFNLVKNATWHDGVNFTSADVKFSYEEIILPFHPSGSVLFGSIDKIETPDLYTVVFKLKVPDLAIISFMYGRFAAILPKHLYEGTDILNNPHNMEPIGTGPYMLEEWVKGSHITMTKNEAYFRKNHVYMDKVIWKFIPSPQTLILSLETGEVDALIRDVPNEDFERMLQTPGFDTLMYDYIGVLHTGLYFNLDHPILSDVKVRQAISFALDRKGIVETALSGIGLANTYGPFHPLLAVSNQYDDPTAPRPTLNVSEANRLLDEAGYPKDVNGKRFEIELVTTTGIVGYQEAAEVMRDQLWQNVGIAVNLKLVAEATAREIIFIQRNFEIGFHAMTAGPDPKQLFSYFHSSTIGSGPFTNAAGYNNTQMDSLLEASNNATSLDERKEIFHQIQNLLMQDMPYAFAYFRRSIASWNSDLKGFLLGVSWRDPLEDVWWVWDPASPSAPQGLLDRIIALENTVQDLQSTISNMSTNLWISIGIGVVGIILAAVAILYARKR